MKTRFKGHETFYFREGWMSKAMFELYAHNDTRLFNDNIGIAKLGVGANMVKSIKYWLITSGLIEYDRKDRKYQLTELGITIINNDGYFEDFFTLWILHINIARNFKDATTWNLFFNIFKGDLFNSEDVKKALKGYLEKNEIDFAAKSLDADVNVLLSMYTKGKETSDAEENLICPLSQLDIIKSSSSFFIKESPDLKTLDEFVILYTILMMIQDKGKEKHININDLENGNNSLGNLLSINKVVINEYLEQLSSQGLIRLEKTAGLDMVYIITDKAANEIVSEYYERRGVL